MDQQPQASDGDKPSGFQDDAALPPLTAEEEAMLDEAEADVEAGRVVDWEDVRAWIHSLGTENPLPLPQPASK